MKISLHPTLYLFRDTNH